MKPSGRMAEYVKFEELVQGKQNYLKMPDLPAKFRQVDPQIPADMYRLLARAEPDAIGFVHQWCVQKFHAKVKASGPFAILVARAVGSLGQDDGCAGKPQWV